MGKWELSNYYDNIEKKCLDVVVREDGFGITVEKSELKNCLKALVDEHNKDVNKLDKENKENKNYKENRQYILEELKRTKIMPADNTEFKEGYYQGVKDALKLLGDK